MSGFYIGVDGKARKVKGAYIGVDGVARKIKKGYIGVGGVARLCWTTIDPVFANNSWEEIAVACQTNSVPDEWAVGDQKTMKIGGTDYVIDIIGKNHDDYSDGSGKAPLTFQLHDCYKTKYPMNGSVSNSGSWSSCAMRTEYLPEILLQMPSEVRQALREVTKLTSYGTMNNTIVSCFDKLFLLSVIEVFGETLHSFAGEGSKYEYYANEERRTKKYNGSTDYWRLRSPYTGNYEDFCYVNADGQSYVSAATSKQGVSFAFCF